MAKRPATTSKMAEAVGSISLAMVIGFGLEGGRVDEKVIGDLLEKGFVETDGNPAAEDGTVLVRATEKGRESMTAGEETGSAETAGGFVVASFAIPASAARRAREEIYPFETLEVGKAFFVPKTADRENPVKSMGSTVSSANARYVEPTGNKVIKDRKVLARGEDGKILVGEDGKRIVAEVVQEEVDEVRPLRVFGVAAVEDGAKAGFGEQFAGVSGAAVYRSK